MTGLSDRVELTRGSILDLPFGPEGFDAAYMIHVGMNIADKHRMASEAARVVKPGGTVAFTEAIWVQPPPEGKGDFMARAAGLPDGLLENDAWREILEASDHAARCKLLKHFG